MRNFLGLCALTLSTVLSACSGASTTPPVQNAGTGPFLPLEQSFSQPLVGGANKIYVTNARNDSLTTYNLSGSPAALKILGLSEPTGMAVDSHGKIYVSEYYSGRITTYTPDGAPTTPAINGLNHPTYLAVDSHGKIYVVSSGDVIRTFTANGTPSTPTITGLDRPAGLAVDAHGKIYVASAGRKQILTYVASGSPSTPTISLNFPPASVAVGATGGIYVLSWHISDSVPWELSLTTFTANGTLSTPYIGRITGSYKPEPAGLALDALDNFYVASQWNNTVYTYNSNGTPSKTITQGLSVPWGIAVH